MTQSFSFNLVDEPWLPCIRLDGSPATINLREVLLQAHQLQSLAGDSPPQKAALHRFLLAILHRLFGPANYDEWANLWDAAQFDAAQVNTYLDKWHHRFDLFDEERPFYQSSELYLESKWVSIHRLVHHLNAAYPLFNHAEATTKDYLEPSEAAIALLTAQGFSLCGTSGAFFPRKSANAKKKQGMFADGVSARGISFLVEGQNLFQTLMLNLIQYPDDNIVPHSQEDAPVWEREDPSSPERGPLSGYIDYLTWQNRRILLKPMEAHKGDIVIEQMRWEPANRIELNTLDPMHHHIKNKKKGFRALLFNEDKVLWRDSAALFSLHHTENESSNNNPPATFRWLKELLDERISDLHPSQTYRCLALGMASKPGQATVYFYRQEELLLPLVYLEQPALVNKLKDTLTNADKVADGLNYAAQIMGMYLQEDNADEKTWKSINKNTKKEIREWIKKHIGLERYFWVSLEIPFQKLITNLPHDMANTQLVWQETLRVAAWKSFEQVVQCIGNHPRSFKALVRGRDYLNYRLNELFPKTKKEEPL